MSKEKLKCNICGKEWDTEQQLDICLELHKLEEIQEKYNKIQDLKKNIFGV